MTFINSLITARALLQQGKIIAYPTETVYGLGCDPFNQQAVQRLLALKQREVSKGLILLIADWSQLAPLIQPIAEPLLDAVRQTWPGPVTWIFPKSDIIPDWVSGQHDGIAIRMSAHPIAGKICLDGPIVSTSANISGHSSAIDVASLCAQFPHGIDAVLEGQLGTDGPHTAIYDVQSGQRLR